VTEALIIENGGANLASLAYALERLGVQVEVSSDPSAVLDAARVIIPGVGSAADAMCRLEAAGTISALTSFAGPVLGICLGMQLLFEKSEEGPTRCIGVLPETVTRLRPAPGLPVPHMGWNQLERHRDDPLLDGIGSGEYVYFVHSYAAAVSDHTLASVTYGSRLSAVVRRGNFWGTQFHPERSGPVGARILANFVRL
jgi:imidazole glycerol-phosphate synthase subunit HisH